MSYFKLKDNDLFVNTIEAYPNVRFFINSGTVYIDNENYISGTHTDNVTGVPRNYISLYEYNINRPPPGFLFDAFPDQATNIYPFVIKNGRKDNFKTISSTDWNTNYSYGEEITSQYNSSASITRYYLDGTSKVLTQSYPVPPTTPVPYRTSPNFYLRALKNTLNYYVYLSPHYSSSYYMDTGAGRTNLITIPSIFYGKRIKKGSIKLQYYITGTLAGEATDYRQNGELVHVSGGTGWSPAGLPTGSVIGTVLYKEGFLLLTSSAPLDSTNLNYETNTYSSWVRFGYGANSGSIGATTPKASFVLQFQGTSHTQTMTILAKAPEAQLNHSNNPTYYKYDSNPLRTAFSGTTTFSQGTQHLVNTVEASYQDLKPPFKKETYISKIALYDEHRNVIGYAKLATPVRKTEEREFIFKLKLDM
jgi:hypothetical protein